MADITKDINDSHQACEGQLFDDQAVLENSEVKRPLWHSAFDFCHSLVVSALVVSYWRGGWLLWDSTCSVAAPFCAAPERERISSALYSEVVGVCLIVIMISTSERLAFVANSVSDASGTAIAVLHSLTLGTSCISLWRGCWYLADQWMYRGDVLHEQYAMGMWVSHFLSFSILVAVGTSSTVLAPPAAFQLDGMTYLLDDICSGVATFGKSMRLNMAAAPIPRPGLINQYAVAAFHNAVPLFMEAKYASRDNKEANSMSQLNGALHCCDYVLSIGFISHLVVMFWRGTWGLMDHYDFKFSIDPEDLRRTAWVSMALGFGVYVLEIVRIQIYHHVDLKKLGCQSWLSRALGCRLVQSFLSTLYIYVMERSAVNVWRGIWYAWDYYTDSSVSSALASHITGILGLIIFGALRSIFASPASLVLDKISLPFPTMLAADTIPYSNIIGSGRATAYASPKNDKDVTLAMKKLSCPEPSSKSISVSVSQDVHIDTVMQENVITRPRNMIVSI